MVSAKRLHRRFPSDSLLELDSDYTIYVWRISSYEKSTGPESSQNSTLHLHNPKLPLPTPPAYSNPSFYLCRPRPASPKPSTLPRSKSRNRSQSVMTGKSRRSALEEDRRDGLPKHKKEFLAFHNENGVRTITGSVGPVQNGEALYLRKRCAQILTPML